MRFGHGHGLDLVVRDVEDGGAELLLDALQLEPQIGAQLGVERGQRLVHQVDRRLAHQRAADGDALHLAAGELRRAVLELVRRCAAARRPASHALRDLGLRRRGAPASAAGRRGCRRPRDADRANIAGTRRRRRARPARRGSRRGRRSDRARVRPLEAGDQAQRRRLAGAGRPEQHDELAVGDGEVEVGRRRRRRRSAW